MCFSEKFQSQDSKQNSFALFLTKIHGSHGESKPDLERLKRRVCRMNTKTKFIPKKKGVDPTSNSITII